MEPRERVEAALRGDPVDRVPLCFWHHFKPNRSGLRMAELTLAFFRDEFDLDIVKVMPDLPYPWPSPPLREAADFARLPRLPVAETRIFQEQLICVRALREALGPDRPIIVTLFSPVTSLLRFFRRPFSRGIQIARTEPAAVEAGLEVIATNLRELMAALVEAGASGIFYSCMGATTAELTPEEYERFGRPYDVQALAGAEKAWCNIVHIHADPRQKRERIHFELFDSYPVQVLSWSDRLTGPSLRDALGMTGKCVMGGLYERGPITKGGEAEIAAEVADAIEQTDGRRLILANGCSIPEDTPERWLHATRERVGSLGDVS